MPLTVIQNNFRLLIWQTCGYIPSIDGQKLFHDSPARFKLMAGGVGAGKSWSTAREVDGYSLIPNGLGWIIGPNYDLARPEFDYLLDIYLDAEEMIGPLIDHDTVSRTQKAGCSFKMLPQYGGFQWMTKSADNPTAIAGRRPDVVVLTEAAQHPEEMFFKALERAAEKRAPVIFSGTFEGSYGWYAEQWESWQGPNPEKGESFSVPTWTNRKIYPGGRLDPEILRLERTMPPDVFQERFGGVPCPPVGLVFKEFNPKYHVRPLEKLYNPDLPVELWVDPATHCYACLFVQPQADGKSFHVLDEVYAKDQIAQEVIPQVVSRPFWKASCRNGVMDIAGKARQMGTQSNLEVWATELRRLNEHPIDWFVHKWPQEEKRHAIRLRLWSGEGYHPEDCPHLGGPLLFFADSLNQRVDSDGRANGVIGELKTYRWAQKGEMSSDPRNPIKKNEDALSALGYGLLRHHGPVIQRAPRGKTRIRSYF